MKTKITTRKQISEAIECLTSGGVVAFPTDTVYGLAVVYDQKEALERLKQAKGRPENKPIPMMISHIDQLDDLAYISNDAGKLIHAFMPGAFTILLRKKEEVEDYITNGFPTIGCRIPEDDYICEIIDTINKPLLVTSANLSGAPTGTTTEEVIRDFDTKIDMIVKGECQGLQSSTIVDASSEEIKIVRLGPITERQIKEILGETL